MLIANTVNRRKDESRRSYQLDLFE